MKFLPLIWASLWRKPLRTAFTMLSIVIAFLLFGVLQGVNAWMGAFGAASHANRLYVVSRVSQLQPLPNAYLEQIRRVPGVLRATPVGGLAGSYRERGNAVLALAVDAKTWFGIYPEWRVAPEQLERLGRTRDAAIVAAPLMRSFGWKVGERIPLQTSVPQRDGRAAWAFEIVGSYDVPRTPSEANRILINYAYLDEARALERGSVWAFVVAIEDVSQAARIAAAIDARFVNSAHETLTQDEKSYVQGQLRQLGDVGLMANAIVAAVLFTLLFLTGNTMMQSVRERTAELAILKTLGFPERGVTLLVVIESLLLCLLAASIGLACAAAAFPAVAALGIGGASLPLRVALTGLSFAAALALISALLPAWRAQRLVIVDALAGR